MFVRVCNILYFTKINNCFSIELYIESIEVNKVGVVRRARIYYLRDLTGKKARIKEKRYVAKEK